MNTLRKATREELDKFIEYRANHVALVRRIGTTVFETDFPEHDKDKIACDADDLNLYALRNAMQNGDYNPPEEDKVILSNLVGRHVKSQEHHPEYWDDGVTVDDFNYEEPTTTDASRMPAKALLELVCDWCAVAIKLNKGLFRWFNKTCTGDTPRFRFTPAQTLYIILCIKSVQNKVVEEKLYYPGVRYTAKKDEPVLEEDVVRYLNYLALHSDKLADIIELA